MLGCFSAPVPVDAVQWLKVCQRGLELNVLLGVPKLGLRVTSLSKR